MNLEVFDGMNNRLILLLIVLLIVKVSLAEQDSKYLGVWRLDQTYCHKQNSPQLIPTKLVKLEALKFEPDVRLTIYQEKGKQYIQKDVQRESCKASHVSHETFLTSRYEANIHAFPINGSTVFKMTSAGKAYFNINYEAIKSCGSALRGFVLAQLTDVQYPAYFYHEAQREYHFAINGDHMTLLFNEPNICEDANTIMEFIRVNSPVK
jgi:hypothetical protein